MEIKRIQLRGISRSPSDRLTEDGGVAESLNICVDNNELAPTLQPEDITGNLNIPNVSGVEKTFVHKTTTSQNFIFVVKGTDGVVKIQFYKDGKESVLARLENDEQVKDFISVGNTLLISSNKQIHYVLYKGGEYVYLGTKIPFPTIEFYDVEVKAQKNETIIDNSYEVGVTYLYDHDIFDADGANAVDAAVVDMSGANYDDIYGASHFIDTFWNELDTNKKNKKEYAAKLFNTVKTKWQQMIQQNADKGIFCNSFWATCALRLYDGSLILGVPQLISPGEGAPIDVCAHGKWLGTDNDEYSAMDTFLIRLNRYFRLGVKLHDFPEDVYRSWQDVVRSVDVFISEDIVNLDYQGMVLLGDPTNVGDADYFARFQMKSETEESFIQMALSKNTFVKVEEFLLMDDTSDGISKSINVLRDGFVCDSKKYVLNTDRLSGRELLFSQTYDIKQSVFTSEGMHVYNNQALLLGASEILTTGTRWFNAQRFCAYLPRPVFTNHPLLSVYPQNWFLNPWRAGEEISLDGSLTSPENVSMRIAYHISGDGSSAYVIGRTENEDAVFATEYNRYSLNKPEVGDLVIYPNPKCDYADLEVTANGTVHRKRVSMYPHPFLPSCTYWSGEGKSLYAAVVNSSDFTQLDEEERGLDVSNKLISTSINNPFIYPITSTVFQARIIGAAVASAALSQGQFGQFPLYVFTEDGIWVMETAADGSFLAGKPLSRDVCVSPESITSIDNAVVFVTAQGVMLLQGSQVVNISPNMNGRHYQIENSARTIIENQDFFCDLLPALSDNTHFMAYVKEASATYDYAGRRLIFIKKDEKYQYVYKLDTKTWHKTAYDANLVTPINSYPECLVQGIEGEYTRIYDLSTILDAAEEKTPMRGVIATRPFDLGEPDVFKAITDVRIRGQFPKGAVKFILLGSNDGINFSVINTLRGKSWKLFRLIILADLDATDRISWVDIGYETRFTNKLR